jgi:Dolichyl-phosphate-mannose-protein mannosyltransferase
MKINAPLATLEKMNVRIFFFLLFAYQLILIFQGFDIADEGFHTTFYQRIYTDPDSVQNNFMFWLSGIIGGAFSYVFSGLGLWGLRLAGVLTITSTLIVSYNLLKKYLNPAYLKLGLMLVVFLLNNNRKTLYYDNLSLLLYVIVIYYFCAGLRENKLGKIGIAGLIAGLNIFTRPPNVTALGLIVVILYNGYLNRVTLKKQIQQAFFFGAGMVLSVVVVLGFMKVIGHYDLFVHSLKLVFGMGADETNRNYGAMNLVKNYYPAYVNSIRHTIIMIGLIAIAIVLPNLLKIKPWLVSLLKYALALGVIAILLLIIVKDKDENAVPLFLFTGISIIAGILILISNTDKNIKLLMLAGCFLVCGYPFGSSAGLYTVGINTFWIAFPIAIDYLFNIRSLNSSVQLNEKQSAHSFNLGISEKQYSLIKSCTAILLIVACLYHAYFYPYFDTRNRIKMHYSLNSPYLKGIFTTQERANSFNELLEESARYIKPGDNVLAYDCMPVFHYVTKTRPYLRNSWPYLYPKDVFKEELDKAQAASTLLPVVIMQTIKTIGSGSDWPTVPLKYDPEWEQRNKGRNELLNEFLAAHHYQQVWTNGMFKILLPGKL